ncbi:MAG: HD-GYP domain-containing protein [Caldilineaceae bacterium]
MSRVAWFYIYFVLSTSIVFSLWVFATIPTVAVSVSLFLTLTLLTTFLTLYAIDFSNFKSFEGSTISVVAAIFLLPAWLYVLHILIAYGAKWVRELWAEENDKNAWYVHLFNIATSISSGLGAYAFIHWSEFMWTTPLSPLILFQVFLVCLVHVAFQQLALGGWLLFVRNVPLQQVHVIGEGLWLELPQACMGYLAAKIYLSEPLLTLLMLAPIALTYRASLLPKLQNEAMAALQRFTAELKEKNQAIQQLNDDLFVTLARIFDTRDPYVSGHAAQVAAYAVAIGRELQLPPAQIEILRQSAYLHDIGKIAIPDAILHKPDRLTESEYQCIMKHTDIGADFVDSNLGLKHLAPFIRHHHERWDGQGYPAGLTGEEIPMEARILNLSDAVEAMASDRPYHRAMSMNQIIEEVKRCADRQFDPQVVDAFIRVTEREGAQFVINSARTVTKHQKDNRPCGNWSRLRLAHVYGVTPS